MMLEHTHLTKNKEIQIQLKIGNKVPMNETRSNCGDRLHDYPFGRTNSARRSRRDMLNQGLAKECGWKSTEMGIESKIYLRKQGQKKVPPESIGPEK
jgi:hypothetical protein